MIPTTKAKQRIYLDELLVDTRSILRRLRKLRAQMHNRRPLNGRRSSVSTRSVSAQIRAYKKLHPRKSMQEISRRFRVSIGRVSELIRGKRK